MAKPYQISDAEWIVMEALWEQHPATAAELIARLAERYDWAPNTIRTMLSRLVKKGVLRCDVREGGNRYEPLVEREACVKGEVDSFLGRIFNGSLQPFLLHFVKNRPLSAEEIRELRRLLDEKEGQ